jgi:hypothetical protein
MTGERRFGLVGCDLARKGCRLRGRSVPASLGIAGDELGSGLVRLCREGVGDG